MTDVKLQAVIAQDAKGYATAMQAAIEKAGDDGGLLATLFAEINDSRVKAATEKVAQEVAASATMAKENEGKRDALRANVEATLVKAWIDGKLAAQLEAIPVSVTKHLTVRVERDPETGKCDAPVVILGEVKVTRTSANGGARAQSLTVDGKEYDSASAAKKALIANAADKPMSRASIIAALKRDKHEVSE